MRCPQCRQTKLDAQYRLLPELPPLDSHKPPQVFRELAGLICPLCHACWYALPGETAETAYARILKEEPRS